MNTSATRENGAKYLRVVIIQRISTGTRSAKMYNRNVFRSPSTIPVEFSTSSLIVLAIIISYTQQAPKRSMHIIASTTYLLE